MAATSTTKLAPRVSKTPDSDFAPEYDPLYDPAYNPRPSVKAERPIPQSQAISPWTFAWMVLILIVAGIVAFRYYDGANAPAPVADQTTTTTDQNTTAIAPPPAVPAAPATQATPPDANATAPAAPADGSTTTPQAPATTTSP